MWKHTQKRDSIFIFNSISQKSLTTPLNWNNKYFCVKVYIYNKNKMLLLITNVRTPFEQSFKKHGGDR